MTSYFINLSTGSKYNCSNWPVNMNTSSDFWDKAIISQNWNKEDTIQFHTGIKSLIYCYKSGKLFTIEKCEDCGIYCNKNYMKFEYPCECKYIDSLSYELELMDTFA